MSSTKKKAPEYFQGFDYGFADAHEMRMKYGRAFAEHGADQLAAAARKRDATPWDKGYAAGYRSCLAGR
jgi:hypothetical protein